MNKLLLVTLALVQLNITYVNAQNRLVLEHRKKARRKKVVNFDDQYEIHATDTSMFRALFLLQTLRPGDGPFLHLLHNTLENRGNESRVDHPLMGVFNRIKKAYPEI